ncbi:MAG: DUF167 domain-containing protein, partial [Candidatus Margulisbacteria bacterium]|nr:DUF167 domain-containing protein [Candidatus Margulisiibacteriota bacterium]
MEKKLTFRTRHTITVKTNARQNKLDLTKTPIHVSITAEPIDGKANDAIIKLFKRTLKTKINIIKGTTSKT